MKDFWRTLRVAAGIVLVVGLIAGLSDKDTREKMFEKE